MHKIPQPSEFVAALESALLRAANIASEYDGRVPNTPKAGEVTNVKAALTRADLECQEAILAAVWEHCPGVALRAEEATPLVARFPEIADAVVVIDPIDGTLHFYLEQNGPYAIIVGLAIGNQYDAALLALPREQLVFEGVRGGGASLIDAQGVRQPAVLHNAARRVLISHGLGPAAVAVLHERGYEVQPACGGAISVAPLIPGVCAGLRLANNDPPNLSVRGRVGVLISREAGAIALRGNGTEFPNDIEATATTLLLAGNRDHLAALEAAVAAIPTTR
jgi:fructose-1,6-bisphosphatase/inositol monophosphatase family enzyme